MGFLLLTQSCSVMLVPSFLQKSSTLQRKKKEIFTLLQLGHFFLLFRLGRVLLAAAFKMCQKHIKAMQSLTLFYW